MRLAGPAGTARGVSLSGTEAQWEGVEGNTGVLRLFGLQSTEDNLINFMGKREFILRIQGSLLGTRDRSVQLITTGTWTKLFYGEFLPL